MILITHCFVSLNSLLSIYAAQLLGTLSPMPFADPRTVGTRLLGGVNYASAAAGILEESGRHYGERFTLSQQVINFQSTLTQMQGLMTRGNLSTYLAKSIAVLVFGSNDYINNYLMAPAYNSSFNYKPPDFANLLLYRYALHILALRRMGLRKFVILGLGPLGCIPNQLARGIAPAGRCVDPINQILGTFNEGLRRMVTQYNRNHPGSIFVYVNIYAIMGDMLNNPSTYGFSVINRACCGLGRNQGEITCLAGLFPCLNRSQYLFWDGLHPTQAATVVIARRAFYGPPNDCYPINVQQMALL
uniref:GDSL esterase/lipase n=1 Tax=Kalanchoe fedtschenkoi TaxID=63787 RepID=A0A7N0U552_KALFE